MKISEVLKEDGRIVKGVNTTVDVDTNEITRQAAKFGNKVDKDGRPPTLSSKVKGKSTNVLFNLGLSESVNYNLFNEALGEIASATEIYVDMDGVLADFFGEWAKIMGVNHWSDIPSQYNIEDALERIRNTEDFWLNLPLTDNAKNLLNLIKQVKGSYKILSSPLANDPRSEPHKKDWVAKNLNFFPPQEVIISHNKAQYATQADGTPNILIDDYGVNIKAWEAAGGYGFKHKDHKFERTAQNIKQHMQQPVEEKWSQKYKRSINCSNPKGFSQKAHCAGRKKNESWSAMELAIMEGGHSIEDYYASENFADGKVKGKSRPGRVKKAGASCNGSVTDLRKRAKNASGEKAKMYHWCANMKSGRKKK